SGSLRPPPRGETIGGAGLTTPLPFGRCVIRPPRKRNRPKKHSLRFDVDPASRLERGMFSAGGRAMLNTGKCAAMAALCVGLAVAAATPASAHYYDYGYGYRPYYAYPYYGYGYRPYYAGWPAAYGYGGWGWRRAYGYGGFPAHGYGCCRPYYAGYAYPGYYARY